MVNEQSSTKFSIPKSIPMKYHTIALENIYALMGFLADGILSNKESLGRLEVQVDHVEQELSVVKQDVGEIKETFATKKDLAETEMRIRKDFKKEYDIVKNDIVKLNQEVFG